MAGTPWTNQAINLIVLTEQTQGFSGLFGYNPTVGAGNLIFSLAAASGTDPYGNSYPAGLNLTTGSISGTTFSGTDYIINASGEFFYSGTPAANNLVASIAPAAGTDAFGNNYLAGNAAYAATFATSVQAGLVAFYAGSLSGGWGSALSEVAGDVAGNLQVNAGGQLQLIGGSGVTIQGSSTTQGPNGTGFFNTQGLASGSYGSTHQHTLPNFPTATHTHNL